MTKNEKGRMGEKIVKKKLRQRGFKVADVSKLPLGCDLVVEEKYRVEVKTTTKPKEFTATLYPEKFDVLCVVVLSEVVSGFPDHTFFIKSGALKQFKSPTRPNDYYFNSRKLGEFFSTRPADVFVEIK